MQSYHPSLDPPQMLTHQTQILLTLIHMSHTSNPYPKNSSPHTQSNTKNPPHTSTNQTNHPKPTNSPLTTPNNISIIQLNINSITKKTTELTHLIHKQKIHIITLQESNLNSKHKTPHIPNFSAIRLDRPSSQKRGGVLTYINNNINYSQIPTPTNLITNNIKFITTKIHLKHSKTISNFTHHNSHKKPPTPLIPYTHSPYKKPTPDTINNPHSTTTSTTP